MPFMWDDTTDPIHFDLQGYMVENDPSQGGSLAHNVGLHSSGGQIQLEPLPDVGDVQLGLYRLTQVTDRFIQSPPGGASAAEIRQHFTARALDDLQTGASVFARDVRHSTRPELALEEGEVVAE